MYCDINGKIPKCLIRFLYKAILNAHKKLVCMYMCYMCPHQPQSGDMPCSENKKPLQDIQYDLQRTVLMSSGIARFLVPKASNQSGHP